MGRKSKFSEKQWEKILVRIPPRGTESIRAVADEVGISEASIRQHISTRVKPINDLAKQLATTELKLESMPLASQLKVRSLADTLKGISTHLSGAAEHGAMTAHRLSMIANTQVERIDESASLEDNTEALKSVMAMTRGANDAAQIGLSMLNANKETVIRINKDGDPDSKPRTRADFYSAE